MRACCRMGSARSDGWHDDGRMGPPKARQRLSSSHLSAAVQEQLAILLERVVESAKKSELVRSVAASSASLGF